MASETRWAGPSGRRPITGAAGARVEHSGAGGPWHPSRRFRSSGRRAARLAVLALLGLAGGCAGVRGVDVVLVSLEPVEATLLEQRLRVNFRILNNGDHAIRATGVNLTLNVNGRRLAQGVDDRAFVLTGLSEARVGVVVSTTLFDVARQLLALPDRDTFSYELTGRLHVDGWRRGVPFSRSGEISRGDLRRLVGAGNLRPAPIDLQP